MIFRLPIVLSELRNLRLPPLSIIRWFVYWRLTLLTGLPLVTLRYFSFWLSTLWFKSISFDISNKFDYGRSTWSCSVYFLLFSSILRTLNVINWVHPLDTTPPTHPPTIPPSSLRVRRGSIDVRNLLSRSSRDSRHPSLTSQPGLRLYCVESKSDDVRGTSITFVLFLRLPSNLDRIIMSVLHYHQTRSTNSRLYLTSPYLILCLRITQLALRFIPSFS